MKYDRLEWLLQKASARGLRRKSAEPYLVNLAPVVAYMASRRVDSDPEMFAHLLRSLKEEPSLRDFEDGLLWHGTGGYGVDHACIARGLMNRTLCKGPRQAVSDLARYLELQSNPGIFVMTIRGLRVDRPLRLAPQIALLPLVSLPESSITVGFRQPNLFNIAGPTPLPESALVLRAPAQPKVIRSSETSPNQPRWYARLLELCSWLTLVGPSAPSPLVSWWQMDGWVPFDLAGGTSSTFLGPRLVPSRSLEEDDRADARSVSALWLNAIPETKRRLRIPLERLNSAMTQINAVEKAIELGIALESLLLDDGSDSELALRLRIRGAWLLGENAEDRVRIMRVLENLYKCRSQAVHRGRFSTGIVSLGPESILNEGARLTARAIRRIAEKGFPEWMGLVLGGRGWAN